MTDVMVPEDKVVKTPVTLARINHRIRHCRRKG